MTTRTILTDETGRWFDESKAIRFEEDSWHNGSNFISKATGSQWEHEHLYFTKSGLWVLNSWSNYQNVEETYEEIDEGTATAWLARHKCRSGELDKLPSAIRDAINTNLVELEM